jgi:type IV pilus assembly protein PilF
MKRPVLFVWIGLWLLVLLAGCAHAPGEASAQPAEPVTESDEPEVRKRARIRTELAANYFEQGQNTVALDEIKQALNADPSYPAAYNLRGLVYLQMNEPALAESSLRRALQLNPRDADAMHNLGWLWCQQARYPESLDQFARALAVPSYANAPRTLMAQGVCQLRAGRPADAERSLTRAFELDASNPIILFNLSNLLYQRGEYQRAQFYIRRINTLADLTNAESLWLAMRIERRLGNPDGVRLLATQLRQRFPDSAEWGKYQRGAFDE